MPQRLDEFNKKFVYTDTNPENIIVAKRTHCFIVMDNNFM